MEKPEQWIKANNVVLTILSVAKVSYADPNPDLQDRVYRTQHRGETIGWPGDFPTVNA